jgi:hypothetical protein
MPDSRDLSPISSNGGFGGSISNDRDLSAIPGNYFTAISDIEPRVEMSEREDRFGSAKGEKAEVSYEARRSVKAGTSLLAIRLHFLDDILHSVTMAPHPEDDNRKSLSFMADEFFTHFVADPNAEELREEAIDTIQAEMKSLRKQISTRPDVARPGLLPAPGQKKPSTTDLVRYHSKSQDIVARMDATISAAREIEADVKEKQASISARQLVLQRYMNERTDAALSSIGDIITFGEDMKNGVKTLSLYTGEGEDGPTVDVQTAARGASAPASEPLTLYQNLLYLDEELAVDLTDGGFDFFQLDDIGNIFASDGSLIERMIPARRGAVLVRVRRDTKNYFVGDKTMAAALRNAQLNAENMVTYLLVRDGENIHLVHSEVTSDLTKHLFPTRHEIDAIFRKHGRDIRPEHLEYSSVKDDFEKRTLYYKRILLMMWGLDARLGLFGSFYNQDVFDSWYDDRLHAERIVYVHDADNAIGEERPSFADWVASKNAMIQTGSRLAVDWGDIITENSAPFCFEERRRGEDTPQQRYLPVERFGSAVASIKDGRLIVKTAVRHKWHDESRNKRANANATVDLIKGVTSNPPSAICLDEVTRDEIRYYLNSRKQRESYLSYLQLFRIMDEILRKDDTQAAPTLDQLRGSMMHSGIPADHAEAALLKAVGMWRASNGGAAIGGEGWKPKSANQVLDLAFALAGQRNDIFERARTDIADCVPIDLRINGKGQFILYWEIPASMRAPFLDIFAEVFVLRSILKIRRDRVELDGVPVVTYAHNPGFKPSRWSSEAKRFSHLSREVSLALDPERLANATMANLADWTTADEAARLHAICDFDAAAAFAGLSDETAKVEISHRVLNIRVHKGQVNAASVVIPLGILVRHDCIQALALECDGLSFLASRGEGGIAVAEALVNRRYKSKEVNIERMRKVAERSSLGLSPLKLIATSLWDGLSPGINFRNEDEVFGRDIASSGTYHSAQHKTPYDDILASVTGETQKEYRDAVRLHFLSEGSRALAERYFAAQKERA